jgi:hypothetical protein
MTAKDRKQRPVYSGLLIYGYEALPIKYAITFKLETK